MTGWIGKSTALVAVALCLAGIPAFANVYEPAIQLERPDMQVMGCPPDATWDPRNGGECWTCGAYAARTLEPIDDPEACVTAPGDDLQPARMLERDKHNCTGKEYFDPLTASCWECKGGRQNLLGSAKGDNACIRTVAREDGYARKHSRTKSLAHSCPKGTFANVGSRDCYECRSGWKHDPLKKVQEKGVCYIPKKEIPFAATHKSRVSARCGDDIYDPIRGGSCWRCPAGYERGVAAVDTAEACFRPALPELKPATRLGTQPIDLVQAARGASTLGCSNQGQGAFFDPKGGGSCWRCPSSHPVRSLYAVDESRACMSEACGAEGGRPCLLWERVPSCNAGLVEDFTTNTCKKPRDFACESYVKTLNGIREAVELANATGQSVQDAVLDAPGAKYAIKALELSSGQFHRAAELALENLDISEVTGRFEEFAADNREVMERLVTASEIASEQIDTIKDTLTDVSLICSKDVERLAYRFGSLGLDQTLEKPRVIGIPMAAAGFGPARPFSLLAGLGSQQVLYANAVRRVIKPHHRMVFETSVSFPFKKSPAIGEAGVEKSATGVLGLQFATNFKDSHGLFFNHGIALTGEYTSGVLSNDNAWRHFGGVDWSIGYQYRGDSLGACNADGGYSWGIPVKVGGFLGLGFNTSCDYAFNGFAVTLQNGNFKKLTEMVTSPAGPTPLPVDAQEWRRAFPGAAFGLGAGWEGAVVITSTEEEDDRGGAW